MKKYILFLFFCLVLIRVASVQAQKLNTSKLDSLFNALEEKNKAMGSLTISKNGQILYERSIGYEVLTDPLKVKASSDTKYRVGSISKMFTAVMIFQLIDEKKLSLESTLATYYPLVPNASKITIGHMLNHHSGLHNITERSNYMEWVQQPKSHEEMLLQITNAGIDFEPGVKSAYSNTNYILLGYIVEKITKKTYAENIKERISTPANLSATYVGSKIDPSKHESYSYEWSGAWSAAEEADMSSSAGAGCMVSTATGLAKFAETLFASKLISSSSLEKMTTINDGYGFGMNQIPFYNKKGFGHTGGIDGFVAVLVHYPEDSLTIAYCSNGHVYPRNDILIGVLNIYYNKMYTIPSFTTVIVKEEILNTYVGLYACKELPIKLTISKDKQQLSAQATGQGSFSIEAVTEVQFKSDMAQATFDFNAAKKELILKQGAGIYVFTKVD
ncbi:MAG: hypothetical protein K0R51_306 [Cytophagaceae bacterium]|jgi:CubicO group peptidase (beta-lactamase class C family)|nr:hypothetical protein [Cytophagaceae bacterium]